MKAAEGLLVPPPQPSTMKVYEFSISGADPSLRIEATDEHTLYQLMEAVCNEWLDEARDGDGAVYAHLWTVRSPVGKHSGPFDYGDNDYDDDDDDELGWDDEDDEEGGASSAKSKYKRTVETEEKSTALKHLQLRTGDALGVTYDMGSTTSFHIVCRASRKLSKDVEPPEAPCLKRPEVEKDAASASSASAPPYKPPEGTPSLDELFPALSALAFGGLVKWFGFFSMGPLGNPDGCVGFMEAGPNALGDVMYCPTDFEDAESFLIAADIAARTKPPKATREDAFSRFVFPAKIKVKAVERKFELQKKELDEFTAAVRSATGTHPGSSALSLSALAGAGLSQKHIYMMCGPQAEVFRQTEAELAESRAALRVKGFSFADAFPRCAAAALHPEGRWLAYRQGVLRVCRGRSGVERGVPRSGCEFGAVHKRISSLDELFCLAESLFPEVEEPTGAAPGAAGAAGAAAAAQPASKRSRTADADTSRQQGGKKNSGGKKKKK